ncbi:copper resistance CopC family protein [Glycomyces albidus]|uniref:copper resistance CopC family protein n=1 Tax=Glycomyces albidus TaxID=2656774 RepID=UPI0018832F23|nr:copper resistance protein CopC [Glycomyces albidus]
MYTDQHHDAKGRPASRGRRTAPARLAIAVLGAVAMALALPSPASAQPVLWATSPEDGAALDAAPGEIALTFSEPLDPASSEVTVTGPDLAPIETEPPAVHDTVLIQRMRYSEPGEYTVTVVAVFESGESLESTLTFSVESIPDMLSTDTAAAQDAGADPETSAESTGSNTAAIVGVALLVALAVAAWMLMARQRAKPRDEERERPTPVR